MKGSQKIGGVGALIQGVLSLSPLVFVFVIVRVQGIFRLNLDNPDILLPFVASVPSQE